MKMLIFVLYHMLWWIVEQGGCCCHSELYSKKLRSFLLRCMSWFSHITILQQERGGNASWRLFDEGSYTPLRKKEQFPCWQEWDGTLVLWFVLCNGVSEFRGVFHECFVYMQFFWSSNYIWLWGVLWLISQLCNLCKLACVTAWANYDFIKTTALRNWGCRNWVLQQGLICLFWQNLYLKWLEFFMSF